MAEHVSRETWLKRVEEWRVAVCPCASTRTGTYPLHEPRSRRARRTDSDSRAWTFAQRDEGCSSAVDRGGTVTYPVERSSSAWTRRARVAPQYFGESSRWRS